MSEIGKSEAFLRMEMLRKKAERGMNLELWGGIGILILPVGLALLFTGIRMKEKANEEMDELYRDVFVREPLEAYFENVSFEPFEGFSEETVEGFQICRMGNEFDAECYGKAAFQDVRVEMSDVTVQDYDRLAKKDNNTTIFKGRMTVLEFPEEIESPETVKERLKDKLASLSKRHRSVNMKVDGKRLILAFNDGDGIPFYRKKSKDISLEKELAKVEEDFDDIRDIISMIC